MSGRKVETVERDGKRVIEIHLAPNEPTIGEMAVDDQGREMKVSAIRIDDEGIMWSDGVIFREYCTLHTPPETVDGVSVEDLRAVLGELDGKILDASAAAARLRKKIEGADQ